MLLPPAYLQAQLNGTYSIDNTQAASATNFTSFTQFASTLNAQGVSGPVTINVGGGPYNEQININQYTGGSATNSVVINGNGRTITFNATNAALRHTIMLSGADFMTWNNLNIIGTNATSALVVHLWNGSNNNTFNNCYIEAPINGTSTTQVPFSISGSSVSATTSGPAGSNNTVNSCTVVGGYYNTVIYGNTGTPTEINNEVRNSILRDYYVYGVYNYYSSNLKIRNNLFDRVGRTLVTTTYGVFLTTNTFNALVEGNYVRNLFPGNNTSTSSCYAIYVSADATASTPNLIRNNVVSDIDHSGLLAGIYLVGADFAYAEHNTISLDASVSTAGTTYGIYATGANDIVRNNNVTIARAGTGTKYGLYYSSTSTNLISDYNNVYVSSTSGTNYFSSLTTNYSTLSAWQAATGYDMNSLSVDPQYASPLTYDYSPTNIAVNNKGLPIGVLFDYFGASRSPLAPDPGAFEIFNSPCSTAPPSNSFVVPTTSVCPGAQLELKLQNSGTYTNSGYVVQWYASTLSSVGGYTAIPGATLNTHFTSPIPSNIYYQAIVTCSNTNQSTTTPPELIMVMPLVQDTVPYYEGFETIAQNGLPNCYWSVSSYNDNTRVSSGAASNNRIARTGNNYAYFKNHPLPNYFYTNQIWLKAGVTYSAALWYITENVGYNPWDEISIHVGPSQTPNGLQMVASVSPVTGQLYTLLSNTLTVLNTGYYYVAVRATGGYNAAPYLTWDDLSITIPCSLNSPILSVLAPSGQVCQGTPVTLQAGGANTYSWSNGVQGSSNVVAPVTNSTYVVYGTHLLSGCSSSAAINLAIKPSPAVGAIASQYSVCSGQSITLSATGADSYYWTTGSTSAVTVVTPTQSTAYVVAGTNSTGCTGTAQVDIQVSPSPVLLAQSSSSLICQGESVELSVMGANTYVWLAPNLFSTASQLTITPQSSAMYTVTGTTQNGCSVTSQLSVIVETCTGLSKNSQNHFSIFPNPVADRLFIHSKGGHSAITITDVSGRVVATKLATEPLTTFDLQNLSAGVYYVQLQANDQNLIEKFIKQ